MSLQTKLQGLVNGKSAVVNSINAKASTSLTVNSKWSDLASAVDGITAGGGGGADFEPIVLTGNCEKACAGPLATKFIELFPTKVSTYNVTNASSMFASSTLTKIPFDINFQVRSASQSGTDCAQMFQSCSNLTELPKMVNLKVYTLNGLFNGCLLLREIPEDLDDTWDWSENNSSNTYSPGMSDIVRECKSLRKLPYFLFEKAKPIATRTASYFNSLGYNCHVIDEAVNLPLPYTGTWTTDTFGSDTFKRACRLKNFTFALNPETNQPYVMNWKKQTIDLTNNCGWANSTNDILGYNSGIGADKRVTDDASYQALKNDPDWWTTEVEYSRYNHDSAVATINSLPDTSAYLATAGGTNTIKFKGIAGAYTDGGAINTLTEAEIAVATAKGWTVVLV